MHFPKYFPIYSDPMLDERDSRLATIFDDNNSSNLSVYKQKLEKLKKELLKFGLSSNQAKIFLYLGKYGPKTAPEVSKALEIPRTETYFIINTLQNRGIVSTEFSSPQRFSALPIKETILTLLNAEKEKISLLAKQETEISDLWKEIPSFAIETKETKDEKMQMLQGTAQICSKIKQFIAQTKEDLTIFCTEKDLSRFYHADILELLQNSTTNVKIIVSPSQTMPNFVKDFDKKMIRLMPSSNDDKCFVIKDSDEILLFLRNANHPSHRVFAILSDATSLIGSMHMLFDLCWDRSENIY